jgi:hypothetical protein
MSGENAALSFHTNSLFFFIVPLGAMRIGYGYSEPWLLVDACSVRRNEGVELAKAIGDRVNHMAYFVVTEGLRERLSASGSRAHHQYCFRSARRRHLGFR